MVVRREKWGGVLVGLRILFSHVGVASTTGLKVLSMEVASRGHCGRGQLEVQPEAYRRGRWKSGASRWYHGRGRRGACGGATSHGMAAMCLSGDREAEVAWAASERRA